jgi:hypothetical protein
MRGEAVPPRRSAKERRSAMFEKVDAVPLKERENATIGQAVQKVLKICQQEANKKE